MMLHLAGATLCHSNVHQHLKVLRACSATWKALSGTASLTLGPCTAVHQPSPPWWPRHCPVSAHLLPQCLHIQPRCCQFLLLRLELGAQLSLLALEVLIYDAQLVCSLQAERGGLAGVPV